MCTRTEMVENPALYCKWWLQQPVGTASHVCVPLFGCVRYIKKRINMPVDIELQLEWIVHQNLAKKER